MRPIAYSTPRSRVVPGVGQHVDECFVRRQEHFEWRTAHDLAGEVPRRAEHERHAFTGLGGESLRNRVERELEVGRRRHTRRHLGVKRFGEPHRARERQQAQPASLVKRRIGYFRSLNDLDAPQHADRARPHKVLRRHQAERTLSLRERLAVDHVGDDDVAAGESRIELGHRKHRLIAIGGARNRVAGNHTAPHLAERQTGDLQQFAGEHAFVHVDRPVFRLHLHLRSWERLQLGGGQRERLRHITVDDQDRLRTGGGRLHRHARLRAGPGRQRRCQHESNAHMPSRLPESLVCSAYEDLKQYEPVPMRELISYCATGRA